MQIDAVGAPPVGQVQARALKQWLHDGHEIALLDVREAGQFGEGHLFLAIPLPYSRLEVDVQRLVPRKSVRVVLVDDDGTGAARLSAQRLGRLGYLNIFVLQGGLVAWKDAGLEVFAGVNVPSKAFGELAEHVFETPHISARELNQKLANKEKVIVLDGRPFAEYQKMSIPEAICCPNGELALRIDDLVGDPDVTVVMNCAGRTRSIIGAQTLINLGISNQVYALENGTQGWFLDDLELEHGQTRRYGDLSGQVSLRSRVERARRLADRFAIPVIDIAKLKLWQSEPDRTTFLCDVRTPEESQSKPLPGAQPAPGGQLIQATDQYVGVRGARIVLVDDDGVRAPVVATWLHMLGWDVAVLEPSDVDRLAEVQVDFDPQPGLSCEEIRSSEVARLIGEGVLLFDVRSGMQFRKGHVAGARWLIRPNVGRLTESFDNVPDRVILMAGERPVAGLVANDLLEAGVQKVFCCLETPDRWVESGMSVVETPDEPSDAECIDYLFFVHDRHDGNKQAARQYLEWEINLVAQMDEQEKAMYRLEQLRH
ncbi:rhodanese-like domain-containing protein [Orrella marina]|uniref:Sulfurtransferase n=1 Tax=Orrella marina TaxID=2163011 RepID=A0A2R4XNP6_9BURK|nr:rhodanese-like domain-containing protein [Orrella marina]AWB35388.1 sulfurtransferase [Orrella marina]